MKNSLFSLSDLEETTIKDNIESKAIRIKKPKILMKKSNSKDTLEKVIGNIEKNTVIQFVSKAEWSTHDLLFHILKQTGPANITLSTWSVSSPVIPKLAKMLEDGDILQLNGLFDWRMKIRCPEAHQFMKYNTAKIRLVNCHAKVTVIQNKEWNITIVGSANLTNNPRIEAGVIFTDKGTADFNLEWMNGELETGAYFDG